MWTIKPLRFINSKKVVLVLMAFVCALSPSPLFALDESFSIGNEIYYYDPEDTCEPQVSSSISTPSTGTGADIKVSMAHANIKNNYGGTKQSERFIKALQLFAPYNPDFVSLNEMHTPNKQLVYKTYRVFGLQHPGAPTQEDQGVRIAYDTARWKRVDGGLEQIHPPTAGNPISARDRYAIWGVFQNLSSGATISIVSTHWNTSSHDNPKRSSVAAENVKNLAQKLLNNGPVLIGGDFNFQLHMFNQAHSPATALKPLGMTSAFSRPADKDVAIDTIFYSNQLKLGKKQVYPKGQTSSISDHPFLAATFEGTGGAGTVGGNCTCQASSATNLIGNGDEERAFNFFIGKGLTDKQSAGVVGNMKAESGVQPMRLQNTKSGVKTSSKDINLDGLGWGLVQWTSPRKMVDPSKKAGKSYTEIDSLSHQLEFLWGQLTATGIGAAANEKAAGDDLKKQTTIAASASSFMLKFERPKDQSQSAQSHRADLANEVYGKFAAGGRGGGTTEDTTSESSTTSSCPSANTGDVVAIAQAELAKGVKEDPAGCDRGNPSSSGSCGTEVDKYTDKHLEYWCADFVSWVFKEAGKQFTGGSSGGWRIASVSGLDAWFKQNGTFINNGSGVKPQPGDVYFMGISHVGIVEKVEGDKIYTISGNTSTGSTGNGDGVGRGTYSVGSSEIYGYGRLK